MNDKILTWVTHKIVGEFGRGLIIDGYRGVVRSDGPHIQKVVIKRASGKHPWWEATEFLVSHTDPTARLMIDGESMSIHEGMSLLSGDNALLNTHKKGVCPFCDSSTGLGTVSEDWNECKECDMMWGSIAEANELKKQDEGAKACEEGHHGDDCTLKKDVTTEDANDEPEHPCQHYGGTNPLTGNTRCLEDDRYVYICLHPDPDDAHKCRFMQIKATQEDATTDFSAPAARMEEKAKNGLKPDDPEIVKALIEADRDGFDRGGIIQDNCERCLKLLVRGKCPKHGDKILERLPVSDWQHTCFHHKYAKKCAHDRAKHAHALIDCMYTKATMHECPNHLDNRTVGKQKENEARERHEHGRGVKEMEPWPHPCSWHRYTSKCAAPPRLPKGVRASNKFGNCSHTYRTVDKCRDYLARDPNENPDIEQAVKEMFKEPHNMGKDAPGCHDCGAKHGELHGVSCDIVRCPRCGEQRLTCGCFGLAEQTEVYYHGETVKQMMSAHADRIGNVIPDEHPCHWITVEGNCKNDACRHLQCPLSDITDAEIIDAGCIYALTRIDRKEDAPKHLIEPPPFDVFGTCHPYTGEDGEVLPWFQPEGETWDLYARRADDSIVCEKCMPNHGGKHRGKTYVKISALRPTDMCEVCGCAGRVKPYTPPNGKP